MKNFLLVLLFAIITFARPPPRTPEWWIKTKTLILKSGTFDDYVGRDKFVVVQFCNYYQPECEKLQPEFDKVTEYYVDSSSRNDVLTAKIDGWTYASTSQEFDVKSFPDILFFNKGAIENPERYEGDMSTDKIIAWIEEKIQKLATPEVQAPESNTPPPPAEEKTPENNKKEEKQEKEVPTQTKQQEKEVKAPPPTENKAKKETPKQENTQQEAETSAETVDDSKKELKIVLNTTLLQAQFDEVQTKIQELERGMVDRLAEATKRLEMLTKTELDDSKQLINSISSTLRDHGQRIDGLNQGINNVKKDLQSSINSHTEKQLNDVKKNIETVRSKVYEVKKEAPKESSFGSTVLLLTIGIGIGGAIGYFVANMGKKAKKGYLVD